MRVGHVSCGEAVFFHELSLFVISRRLLAPPEATFFHLTTLGNFCRGYMGGKQRDLSVLWVVAKWVVVLEPGELGDLWHFATAA